MELPSGLTTRPLTRGDAHAVFEVMAAQERHDLDEVLIEEADIVGDWSRPSFDVGASTIGVFDGGRLVAYGEVDHADRGNAAVDPAYRARGLGTALACWMQETARARGGSVIGMPVPQGSDGDRLLEALGYHVRWTSWGLALPPGAEIASRELPAGYAVRAADASEYEQCWALNEDAFLEWSVRDRTPFEDWRAEMVNRPGFEPWNLRVVLDGAGTVVAMCWVQLGEQAEPSAFIARLATRQDQRGRGLAQALLVNAFAVARSHGAVRSELSTDSRTGALGLYRRVGMTVTSTWVNRAVEL